jgi:hypothetical protein
MRRALAEMIGRGAPAEEPKSGPQQDDARPDGTGPDGTGRDSTAVPTAQHEDSPAEPP